MNNLICCEFGIFDCLKYLLAGAQVISSQSVQTVASETWDDASETLILLDWDDTLCPSTSCSWLVGRSEGVPKRDI